MAKIKVRLSSYKSIETTEDCYVLLYNGYILENITGGIVTMDGCNQIVVQRNKGVKRKLPYKFGNPRYWYVTNEFGRPLDVTITRSMRIKASIKMFMCKLFN